MEFDPEVKVSRARFGLVGVMVAAALAPAAPSGSLAAETPDYAGVRATLSREIPKLMREAHTVGLTIALVDGDRTVWARGFGSADRATGRPVTADTLFHIGSNSKTMTAAAVMQLVEEGKVDLDAPLSRYVPRFKMLPRFPGNVVTVRSVLDMHSGIPGDVENGQITAGKPYPQFRASLLRTLSRSYPERRINTVWAYSNSGFTLLQNLIENVTGQSFLSYMREYLFGPMGMAHTTFDDTVPAGGELSHGYQAVTGSDGAVKVVAQPREYVNAWGTGSVVSSAGEMASYLKTMIADGVAPGGERILGASTLQEMTTPQTHLPLDITNFKAGLGWWIGDSGNKWMGPAVYWNGDTANFHTFFRWLPKLGVGAFVSVNTSTVLQVQEEVGLRALGLMVTAKTGRTAPTPPTPAAVTKVSTQALRRAAGRYANSSAGLFTFAVAGDGLRLAKVPPVAGFDPVTVLPRADGWYVAKPSPDPMSAYWIKPATVAGHRLMLVHLNQLSGTEPNGVVTILGEKIPSGYRIPQVWRARLGRYRATNDVTEDVNAPRTGELRITHGVLEWNGVPLTTEGPDLAFTYGLSSVLLGRGEGDALVPSGKTMTILGVHYRKVEGHGRNAAARAATVGSSAFDGPPVEPDLLPPPQQTTPIVGTVIASPEPVLTSNGRNQLAYEIQLTNRLESTVTVHRIEALAGDKVVEKLSGKSLEAVMQPFGQRTTSVNLGPGQTGFVLMDVSLARKAKIPAELTHRIVISLKPKPPIPVATNYEFAPVKVTRRQAILLHPPVYGPGWIIGNGCCANLNAHRSVVWPVDGKIHVAERFAIDFSQINAADRYLEGPADQLTSSPAYGDDVHAVADGTVVSVRDDIPETPAGTAPHGLTLEEGGGNQIVLAIGHGRYAFYGHLQHGSISVHKGQRVKVGQTIARLGNSGNSVAVHLHFHLVNGPNWAASNGMPYRFTEFNVVGKVVGERPESELVIDQAGHGIRHDELPMDEQIVEFPAVSAG
jgi:CubicO group peptidase (beta-lactamase class C family)